MIDLRAPKRQFSKQHIDISVVCTHFGHLVIELDQSVNHFDSQKAVFVLTDDCAFVFENVGRYDGCKVMSVHLASRFFIDL